jgi:hypothetical protein
MTADNIRATATPHKSRISSFKVRDAWMRRLLAADGEKLSPCAKNPSSWLNAECWADEPAKPIGGDMRPRRTWNRVPS